MTQQFPVIPTCTMWFILLLLSTATSLVRVHGRPQDLSKLPPDEAAVPTAREFLTRGADGASLSETGNPTETPSIVTDSAATDSAAAETTEASLHRDDVSTDSEQTPAGEEGQPTDAPPSDATAGDGESPGDATAGDGQSSGGAAAGDGESSGGAAYSEDSPAGGREEEAEVTALESSTIVPVPVTSPPEPAVPVTSPPEPTAAETEAPEPAVAETEAPEPAVAETEAPEPAVAETEAPESAVAETEAPEPAVAETEAPEPAHAVEPAASDAAAATEAPQETEQPVTEPGPAAEEVPTTEPASATEESATEAVPGSGEPATEAAATTPERSSTEAASATETPQDAADSTTVAAEQGPEGTTPGPKQGPEGTTPGPEQEPQGTTPGPEQGPEGTIPGPEQEPQGTTPGPEQGPEGTIPGPEQEPAGTTPGPEQEPAGTTPRPEQGPTPVSSEDAEQGEAAADVLDSAAQEESSGAASSGAGGEEKKLEKLEVTGDIAAAVVDGDGAPTGLVELSDVYTNGVTSQMGSSSALTDTVQRTMISVFLQPREVAYRLGRHTVNTQVTDLQVTGINDMDVVKIASNMDDMSLNVTFQFPRITFSGSFNATGSILGHKQPGVMILRTPFPSYGSGKITAVITNTTAVSQAELSHSFNDRKLAIELLTSHLSFAEPEVRLTELKLPRALQKLYFERLFTVALGKMISHQLETEIEPKVDESLHAIITSVLDQVSLDKDGALDFVRLGTSPGAWHA